MIREPEAGTPSVLSHDSSTNHLIKRYRQLKNRLWQ
jgi:hypothetical protein